MNLKSVPLHVWTATCAASIGLIDVVVFHHIWSGCLLIAASVGLAAWAWKRFKDAREAMAKQMS
jgi:Flp pilus assembly protein TadB